MRSRKDTFEGSGCAGSERIRKYILAIEAPFCKPRLDLARLRQQGILLYRTLSLAHARTIWQSGSFDLMVVDENLGEDPVLEFCRELKERYPQQKIALITENAPVQCDVYVDKIIRHHERTMSKRASTLSRAA